MKKCGGCQYIEVPYEKQLADKQKEMQKLLGKYGKVEPIIGMKHPYHYRHKVHAAFGYEKGAPISGIYEEKSHRIVKIDRCMIEHEKADEIILSIRSLLKSFKIRTYDEKTDMAALLRTVKMLSENDKTVLAARKVPEKLRYRQLLKMNEKGVEVIENA